MLPVALTRSVRLLVLALLIALSVTTLPTLTAAGVEAAAPHTWKPRLAVSPASPTDAMSQAKASGERVEDRSKWNESSRTYAEPDGTWTTEVSSAPENFKDSRGTWRPIDSTLTTTGQSEFAAASKAGLVRLLVPSDAGRTPVRLEDNEGGWVSFRLHDTHGAPVVKDAAATIADGPGDSNVRYDSVSWGVKESITLPAAPDTAPSYVFDLRLAEGMTPSMSESDEVVVTDAERRVRFEMPAPFMQDAGDVEDGSTTPVAWKLERNGSDWRVTMTPDYSWLSDPAREYPVVIDPTTTLTLPAKDGYLQEEVPNTSTASATYLRVGSLGTSGTRRRALVKFTLPANIPTGATVDSATLGLYLASAANSQSNTYGVREMTTAWAENATWNDSNISGGVTNWDGATGYFKAATQPTISLTGAGTGDYKNWDVATIVGDWVANPSVNQGFIVKATVDPGPNELRFYSGDATASNVQPKLTINWSTAPPTITTNSLGVSPSLTSSTGGKVARSLTPTLSATAQDPDSLSIGYHFDVLDSNNNVIASSSPGTTKTNSSPGTPMSFSWAVPAGVLAEGGSYKAKFMVSDETTTSGPTATLPFTVDQAPGTPSSLTVDPATTTSAPWTTTVLDPQLTGIVTDPGAGDPVKAVFQLRKLGDTSENEVGADEVESGQRAGYTVPADGPNGNDPLMPGSTYEFRVGALDALAQSQTSPAPVWSSWTQFTVDKNAFVFVPLQEAEPLTVWDSGPELSWTAYRNDTTDPSNDLAEYQIFRSCISLPDGACTNPVSTYQQAKTTGLDLVGSVPPGTTDFRDTTAMSSSPTQAAHIRYWIVARTKADLAANCNGAKASNSRDVDIPRQGRVRRIFIGDIPDATLSGKTGYQSTKFPDILQAGNNHPTYGVQRALLDFDVSVIKPGMTITQASLQVNQSTTGMPGSFGLYKVGKTYIEDQATWSQAADNSPWSGGDLDPTALSTVSTAATGPVNFADSAAMRKAVQDWVNDRGVNHGVAIRATDESTTGTRRWLDLVTSESLKQDATSFNELRPRLVVEHLETSTLDQFAAADVPQRYVPNTIVTVPVTLTNTTDTAWPAGMQLSYRWTLPGGTTDQLTTSANRYVDVFPGETSRQLQPGESVTVNATIVEPNNSDTGANQTHYDLYFDLYRPGLGWWTDAAGGGHRYYLDSDLSAAQKADRDQSLADQVCTLVPTGFECPNRIVEQPSSDGMGLEKFGSYAGEETGSGSQMSINLDNGNLVWSYDAMSNPSVGPSFFARVAYNSQDATPSGETTLPYGWSIQPGTLSRLNSPLSVSPSGDKGVTMFDGDGTQHRWADPVGTNPLTYSTRPAGVHLDLTYDGTKSDAEQYCFQRPDGTRFYYYGSSKLPSKVVDISGNTLTYAYVSGRLDHITDSKNRTVATLAYNPSGRIASIQDISGRALSFAYTTTNGGTQLASLSDGNATTAKTFKFVYSTDQTNNHAVLVKVTDPRQGVTKIGYYQSPQSADDTISATTYPENTTQTVPSWVSGKVRSYVDRAGQTSEVEYYDANQLPSGAQMPAGASRYSRVFDKGGSSPYMTTYGIDGYGRTLQLKDAKANDPNADAETKLSATRLSWDADHNVVRLEDAAGAVSRWLYNPQTGYPRKTWDAEAVRTGGSPTVMTYYPATANGAVMLKSITTPLGNTSNFAIDSAGRLTSVTDPEGGTVSYTYNTDGTLATTTDPRSNVTSYSYPAGTGDVGYPTLITPPTRTAPGDGQDDLPTFFEYDERGNVKRTGRRDGSTDLSVTRATYDVFGRNVTATSPGAQGPDRTTSYTYDENDNVKTVTAPNDAVTTTTYRADDQAETTTLPSNGSSGARTVVFAYDPLGRLCREVAPNAGATSASCPSSSSDVPPMYATDYQYDALGQLLSTTKRDDSGNKLVARSEYDLVGDVKSATDPKGNAATFVYDQDHRQVSSIDPLGNTSRVVYDADGQVIRSIDPAGKVTSYTFDKAGRNKTTTVTYDAPGGDPQKWTVTNDYDKAGNLTQVTRPRTIGGTPLFSTTEYDENNRPFRTLSAFDPNDSDSVYQTSVKTYVKYDRLGRMIQQSEPTQSDTAPTASDAWSNFTYYDSGEIATSVDPAGISTAYEYNALGKQTSRTLTGVKADGTPSTKSRVMSWTYNSDGSLRARYDSASPAAALVTDDVDPSTSVSTGWTQVTPADHPGQYGTGYRVHAAATGSGDSVTWNITPGDTGTYRVQFSCPARGHDDQGVLLEPQGSRTSQASYTLRQGATTTVLTGDQTDCGDKKWRLLNGSAGSTVQLSAGTPASLSLTPSADGSTVADAVRLVRVDLERGFSYAYDRDGSQTSVTNNDPGARVSSYATAYDNLGRALSVKELAGSTVLRQTSYTYDLNSNPLSVSASRSAQSGGSDDRGNLALTSSTSFTWDARNLVDTVTASVNGGTSRTWDYAWNSRGLLESLTKPNASGTQGAGNVVRYSYYDNGLLRRQTETIPGTSPVVVSDHQLSYNPDGDPVRDISKVLKPDATGSSSSSWRSVTTRYAYSPRQQLLGVTKEGVGKGQDESYGFDVAGNLVRQVLGTGSAAVTTTSTFVKNRLASMSVSKAGFPEVQASSSSYGYDEFGRLASITGKTGPVDAEVLASQSSYTYDGFDRVVAEASSQYDGTGVVTSSSGKSTVFDPLDRPSVETVTSTGGAAGDKSRKTRFNYLGLTTQVAAEEQLDSNSAWQITKAYSYGPGGGPLALTSTPLPGTSGGVSGTRYLAVVDSHALVYNPDGDAVRDIMRVQKPGDPSSSLLRPVKYAYTPVGQFASVSKQGVRAGLDESYGYDVAGNVVSSTVGKTTTESTFVHNRLASTTTTTDGVPGSVSSTYGYDEFGRLLSVTGDRCRCRCWW